MTTSAPAPAPIPVPASSPKPQKRHRAPTIDGFITMGAGCELTSLSYEPFLALVEQAGIRTRLLPGQKRVRFSREDLERVMRESIQVGLPKPASA